MKRLLRLLCLIPAAAAQPQTKLPPGDALAIIHAKCLLCHGEEPLLRRQRDHEAWRQIVNAMDANGARLTQDEISTLVSYFSANFGSVEAERVNVNKAAAFRLAKALKLFPEEAESIVAYRERHGDFRSLEDLEKVPGIDAKIVEAAKDRLAFQ